jgi:hypothetical protein
MADKGLDFSGWKKIKEGPDSTEFQHADGHTMQVAHKSLSPQLKKQLKSLPAHMAEGTEEPIATMEDGSAEITPAQPGGLFEQGVLPGADPNATPEEEINPQLKDPVTASQVAESGAQIQGLEGQQAATTGIAQEEGKIAEQQAPDVKHAANEQQGIEQNLQASQQKMQGVFNDAVQAMNKGEIQPQHLFQGKELPQRIGTAISLILGGMGGGILHQENPVLKQMNQEIQNDLQAQQLNKTNKLNLMGAISTQLGHSVGAAQVGTAIVDEYLKNQINAKAMALGTPVAMQKAQLLNAQLTSGQAPALGHAAYLATMMRRGVPGSPSAQGADPDESLVRYYWSKGDQKSVDGAVSREGTTHGISPGVLAYASNDTKKSFVSGPEGKQYNTGSPENATKYNEEMLKYEPLIKDLQGLHNFNGLSSKLKVGPAASAAEAAAGRVEQQLLALGSSGRLSETALGFSKGLFADPTKLKSMLSNNAGTDQLIKSLSQHTQAVRQQYAPGMRAQKITEKKRQ